MPLPKPQPNEEKSKFISRCISFVVKEMPQNQAIAVCHSQWRRKQLSKELKKLQYGKLNKKGHNK